MNMRNEPELVAGEERLLFGKLAFCSVLILFLSLFQNTRELHVCGHGDFGLYCILSVGIVNDIKKVGVT